MTSYQSKPLHWVVRPFQEFVKAESFSGIFLIVCTAMALIWANSSWGDSYFHLWRARLPLPFTQSGQAPPLDFWINDGLMAVFFLLVGLEIKREALIGELATFRQAALPIAAAIGGMVVPALIYCAFNSGSAVARGWGIPMATDIAFALGVLALMGNRIPASLRIFLAALAIADDIGAVLVIAFFYTDHLSLAALGAAALCFLLLLVLSRSGVRGALGYIVLGVAFWVAFLQSGIHPTVAGVLLAFTIPARGRDNSSIEDSPMLRWEHRLAPIVSYVIMPVFALANAGLVLDRRAFDGLTGPISLGILLGLFLGKPVGISVFSWISVRVGLASIPRSIAWRQIAGAGVLGGIGFTMSLFIANLAFEGMPQLGTAKMAILAASLVSGITGAIILLRPND